MSEALTAFKIWFEASNQPVLLLDQLKSAFIIGWYTCQDNEQNKEKFMAKKVKAKKPKVKK